ncbi:MAG TPA: non-ribosomal peptide synthetase, partial [Legionellaceae bacterium]|nr:non-ribosomal peptide synthetase [Legionellaceae bacterium]
LDLCVHQLFEKIADTYPNQIAITWHNKTLTYAQLNQQANQIAHFLINEGVVENQLIAIYIDRSIEMIVGLLGSMKSGGAYLPLDYNYPEKNLKFMFEDSGAAYLLTQRKFINDIPFETKKIIFIEDVLENIFLNNTNPTISYSLDSLCYVLYTSGSTGYPKGVMLPHKSLTNLMCWHLDKVRGVRNVLQFTTLNFDMSFMEIFSAFCSGGTLTLISEQERLDLFGVARIIQQNKIQQLMIPVAFLKSLTETSIDKAYFKSLCEIIVAGEQLIITPAILKFFEHLNTCRLWNYYGPAESHVVTSYEYPEDTSLWPDYAPIGQPINNTKILILDDEKQLLPAGGIGEIYIGGVALANGYINRNELTHEKFILDPWGNQTTDRLYQTGDFGKYLPNNNIVYLGRKDEQVKIRGFRIELQEIELHLTKHPAIKEAVVIAKKSVFQDKHLEAFIVTDNEIHAYFIDELYTFLQERLSPHMLPSKFNFIKQMPLTNSGKINRNVLEEYESTISYSIDNIIEPSTEIEREVIGILEAIFKLKIGINYSFIAIGGNSLLAMQIVSILRDKFNVEIPAHSILSAPTIGHIAKHIDSLICYA